MKRLIVIIAILAGFSIQLSAQTKKEKITELFKLMKTDKMVASVMDNITKMFPKSGTGDTQKDSAFAAYAREEGIAFTKKMMDENMVDLYDKYFTIDEIDQYVKFYKSAAGQKMTDVMPALQKDLMTKIISSDMPEFQEKLKKKSAEIYGTTEN